MSSATYFRYGNSSDSNIAVAFTESDSGEGGWGINSTASVKIGHGASNTDERPYSTGPSGRWSHRIDIDFDVRIYRYHRECYARGYLRETTTTRRARLSIGSSDSELVRT
jgi:hypothetical protein